MSSPACADGYDTPAQQREDSTTFMVAKVSLSPAGWTLTQIYLKSRVNRDWVPRHCRRHSVTGPWAVNGSLSRAEALRKSGEAA